MIRVVLADDHALVRAGIRSLLELMDGVTVVSEAGDGHEALALIERLRPHVAVLDISMPGLNGIEVASRVARGRTGCRTVIVSMHATAAYVRQALVAGAAGYVLKDGERGELERAVRAVARGDTYLTPAVSGHLAETIRHGGTGDSALERLTPRHREVLQLVAEGLATKAIARKLGITVKTVETHRAHLMERLGIRDVPGLVRYAVRVGLVDPAR